MCVICDEIFENVKHAMQDAEEIWGPSDSDYIELMGRISKEATYRAMIVRERIANEQ